MSRILDWVLGRDARASGGTSDLLNPAKWLTDALGGKPASTGKRISADGALALDTYFACIRCVSEDLGKLPKRVHKRLAGGGSEVDEEHPHLLVYRRANPFMSTQAVVEVMTHHALGWGNGYAEVQRTRGGKAVAYWPIHPYLVTPVWAEEELWYRVQGTNGNPTIVVPSADMIHVHGLGPDGIVGYPIAVLAREDLGLAQARKEYAGAFYANRTQIGGILEYPRKLDDGKLEALRKSWTETYGTPGQSWKPVILESGMKWTPTAIPPKDAQWIEGEAFGVVTICRWFRVPPHKVGHLDRATFSNIEHQALEYVTDTLQPWSTRWELELEAKLLEDDPGRYVKFAFQALLRGDFPTRTAGYRTLISTGAMTPNEARSLEDLRPSKQKGADSLWLQGAMAPLDRLAEAPAPRPSSGPGGAPPEEGGQAAEPKPPEPPAKPAAPADGEESARLARAELAGQWEAQRTAVSVMLRDGVERARRREASAFERASKRTAGDPHAFEEWLGPFVLRSREVLVEILEPAVTAFEQLALATGREQRAPVAGALAAFSQEWKATSEAGMRAAWGRRTPWSGGREEALEGGQLLEALEATLVPMEV